MELVQILRVETKTGRGMYDNLWFECDLPNDMNHPIVLEDSLYQENLTAKGFFHRHEPSGHRFGFLNLDMLRRWIYRDDWLVTMGLKGAVVCTYTVPTEALIVGRTQITFDFEKSVCVERKPLASVLERA